MTPHDSLKACSRCRISLPIASFGKDRSRPPLFLQARCRPCSSKAVAASYAKAKAAIAHVSFDDELQDILRGLNGCTANANGHLLVPMRDRRRHKPADHLEEGSANIRNWLELHGAHRQLKQGVYAVQWGHAAHARRNAQKRLCKESTNPFL